MTKAANQELQDDTLLLLQQEDEKALILAQQIQRKPEDYNPPCLLMACSALFEAYEQKPKSIWAWAQLHKEKEAIWLLFHQGQLRAIEDSQLFTEPLTNTAEDLLSHFVELYSYCPPALQKKSRILATQWDQTTPKNYWRLWPSLQAKDVRPTEDVTWPESDEKIRRIYLAS